jgi:hypothetical protein
VRRGVYLGAGLAAGVALAAALWASRGTNRAAEATTAAPPASQREVAELREELAALRAELAAVRAEGGAHPHAAAPAAPAVAKPAAPSSSSPEEAAAANAAMAARVESAFAAERPDPAWSATAASSITRELEAASLGGALRGVTCASTMCRLEVSLADPELRASLSERLTDLDSLKTQMVYVHQDGDPAAVTIYAARKETTLPL